MNDNDTKSAAAEGSGVTSKTESTPGVAESTGSKFYTMLVHLGVPAVAAAAIVGAIYAALVALGVLALPGCMMKLDVLPGGEQHFRGEFSPLPVETEGK